MNTNSNSAMRILLIGAVGQIGYSLTWRLTRTPHQITALVRDQNRHPFPGDTRILERRSFDRQTLSRALQGIDHDIYCLGLPEQYVYA